METTGDHPAPHHASDMTEGHTITWRSQNKISCPSALVPGTSVASCGQQRGLPFTRSSRGWRLGMLCCRTEGHSGTSRVALSQSVSVRREWTGRAECVEHSFMAAFECMSVPAGEFFGEKQPVTSEAASTPGPWLYLLLPQSILIELIPSQSH